ncbi:MAG: ATP-grasp domain-containing protein [Pseudomonadota bacterium]
MQGTASKRVLLTSGRLPVSLELARAFHAAGWHVVVADPWSMHLCRMSNRVQECIVLPSPQDDPEHYLDELVRHCSEHRIDLVIPVSEETPYVAALVDGEVPVFTSSADTVLSLHDKLGFIQVAQLHSLEVPDTARADEDTDDICAAAFVSKPRFSCSGRGVRFHHAGDKLPADSDSVVQQRLVGTAVNVFCIADSGELRLATAYRGRLADGSVSIAFERDDEAAACTAWAHRFIQASKYTGLIAFDFIVDAQGVARPIECNPRATSGIHFAEPDALVAAITAADMPDQTLKASSQLAEKWSCFTRYLASLGAVAETREAWQVLSTFSDISWRGDDPWPFLAMPVNSWRLLWKALSSDHSFASAAVADIEWRRPSDAVIDTRHDDH